jgi:tellurite methyltransferase
VSDAPPPDPGSPSSERARWEERWTELRERERPPSRWLIGKEHLLPAAGRALDWAGGDGRNALWLAERGLDVLLADIAPTALATAAARAEHRSLPLRTLAIDLSQEAPPAGPWDLILCHHYFDPRIFQRALPLLGPGGVLLVNHPTRRNLERSPRPPAHFLHEEGALLSLARAVLGPGQGIVAAEEEWGIAGRHEAGVVIEAAPLDLPPR